MKRWQFWLGVLISAFFLYWAFSRVHWGDFLSALQDADYIWLIPGVLVYFLAVWIRAWRWHYLLKPVKAVPTRVMFPITAIGYMGNNVYPARAGEVLRAVVLKRREGVPVSASLATVIVERIFDGVVMLAFVFVNLGELAKVAAADSGYGGNIETLTLWGAGVFAAALVTFLVAAMFPQVTARLVRWLLGTFAPGRVRERLLGVALRFLDGLASLRSPWNVLMIFFTSVLIWLLETVKYWFVMHAFPFEVSFFALMLLNGLANLATTIPSAPGYVGTWEKVTEAILTAFGVTPAVALGYAVVLHVALWLPITLLGAWYLAQEGVRWQEAMQEAK
jgi:hypothetical protein